MATDTSVIFQPIKVGDMNLSHRIVMAPLTRHRSDKTHTHTDLNVTYYSQRACYPGTLLITEATLISDRYGVNTQIPGVWTEAQTAAWKKIADAVHARGSYVSMQVWALGRGANIQETKARGIDYVSASDVALSEFPDEKPRPLTIPEIKQCIQDFATTAENSIKIAGLDAIELHSANGYLLDQFLQDVSNKRSDEYGGSIENRCRLTLEVLEAVVSKVGQSKAAIRLAPWGRFLDMRMEDPLPTFTYLIKRIVELYPNLAYISLVEPRASGDSDLTDVPESDSNDYFRTLCGNIPVIVAGGFTSAQQIAKTISKKGGLVALGRYFIPNPDIVERIKNGTPWTPYDRSVFYLRGEPRGYIDYPKADGSPA